MTSSSHVITSLTVDGFYHNTATLVKGNNAFLDLHGAWARYIYAGPHYFNILYYTPAGLSFTNCKEKYKNNQNLYAMMLPPSCSVTNIQPKGKFSLNNCNRWAPNYTVKSKSRLHHVPV